MQLKKFVLSITVLCLAITVSGFSSACSTDKFNIEPNPKISADFDKKLNEYASLLVNYGLKVKQGDTIFMDVPVSVANLARRCVDKAYDAGAREVAVRWWDKYTDHEHLNRSDKLVLSEVPEFTYAMGEGYVAKGASYFRIITPDPTVNNDVDKDRISQNSKSEKAAKTIISDATSNENVPWLLSCAPDEGWAKAVFPDKSAEDAVDALWRHIFEACRVTGDGTAVQKWEEHARILESRAAKMNEYNFKTLHYTNSLGTDLTLDLPKDHVWKAATSHVALTGHPFVANIPTEEIWTAPNKNTANGKVYATKPLQINGNVVRNFWLELKDGKIIDCHAEENEGILRDTINTDEGSHYFGEVALVPQDTPISRQNIIYYRALFDENASCHIAIGSSYSTNLKGGQTMSKDQLLAAGMNQSSTHNDFMLGTDDLKIVGTTWDGKEITFFENGAFTF